MVGKPYVPKKLKEVMDAIANGTKTIQWEAHATSEDEEEDF